MYWNFDNQRKLIKLLGIGTLTMLQYTTRKHTTTLVDIMAMMVCKRFPGLTLKLTYRVRQRISKNYAENLCPNLIWTHHCDKFTFLFSMFLYAQPYLTWSIAGDLNSSRIKPSVIYTGNVFLIVGGPKQHKTKSCKLENKLMECKDISSYFKEYAKPRLFLVGDKSC